ncbi:flavin reductase family protein [Novosphingobium mathurense]|uniref:flavin reductase family protein n=1 Tax=Novosphingobium mathurense TaxID=428990 RepID=UPI0009A8AFDA|nr:flavin reductase family protein [Novosphingobium mathurense]
MAEIQIEAEFFRRVLGNYPTGVCVVTATDSDDQPLGMVVGSFGSISLDPPLVGFFPARTSTSWPRIAKAGRFCVNVMAIDQATTCRQIASVDEKFLGVDYEISEHGLPVLKNSLAAIQCHLESVLEAGDHLFVMGRVVGMEVMRDADPMLFFKGEYGAFSRRA